MRSLLRLIATIVVAAIGTAAVAVAATPEVAHLATSFQIEAGPLPALAELTQQSVVYDALGNQIDELRIENRANFSLSEVPKDVIDAVVATEDEGFFTHRGVSAKGVARAALANANSTSVQGGSTITQQLIKNALVGSERTTRRKVLEAAYAVRLEREWTKEEILERYLNTIYLGNNAYGFQAAAMTYFGKPVSQLDLYEGAFLAGLIRNPVGYDPIQRSEQARARFKDVIDRLVTTERLTEAQAVAAKTTWAIPDRLKQSATPPKATGYFTAEVRNQLLVRTSLIGANYQERYQRLFRGGLKVYTTFDPNIQASAERARDEMLPDTAGRFDAAIVTLDTKTAAVKAMVGGFDFERSKFNPIGNRKLLVVQFD